MRLKSKIWNIWFLTASQNWTINSVGSTQELPTMRSKSLRIKKILKTTPIANNSWRIKFLTSLMLRSLNYYHKLKILAISCHCQQEDTVLDVLFILDTTIHMRRTNTEILFTGESKELSIWGEKLDSCRSKYNFMKERLSRLGEVRMLKKILLLL